MADDGSSSDSDHVVIEMAERLPAVSMESTMDTAPKPDGEKLLKAKDPRRASKVLLRKQRDDGFDTDMLRRAIADTGRWAYGTISVEAFVFDERTGCLVRPPRAFWFCPVVTREAAGNEAMMRIVDDSREDYVGPQPYAPGIGLAGALWSELNHDVGVPRATRAPVRRPESSHDAAAPRATARATALFRRPSTGAARGSVLNFDAIVPRRRIAWREVAQIANDPDQPYNLRLQIAVQAGIGLAAGVYFHFRGTQGVVVYMARGTTDVHKLKSPTNEQYLLSAADVIGSIAALRAPRNICLDERRKESESVRHRVRDKMVAITKMGGSFLQDRESDGKVAASGIPGGEEPATSGPTDQTCSNRSWNFFKRKLIMIATKYKGSNNEPPPPFTTVESIWSFFGCFLTLLMLLNFSEAITKEDAGLSLVMGPFGALMTLQYNLTPAPASQPRNIILGQAISLSIALGMTYTSLPANLKKSLGTSLAIMCMARLGVTHPPAGAAALIFTGGAQTWAHMGLMLVGNILAIFSATVINDLNKKRQYPTFWGFGYWRKHFVKGM